MILESLSIVCAHLFASSLDDLLILVLQNVTQKFQVGLQFGNPVILAQCFVLGVLFVARAYDGLQCLQPLLGRVVKPIYLLPQNG